MTMEKKSLWILEDDFSQDWKIDLESIECCIRSRNRTHRERCEYQDKQMIEVVGNEPADYGYIALCPDDTNDDTIILGCRTKEDYDLAYSRICDAIVNHPHCIDLRGIDLIYG